MDEKKCICGRTITKSFKIRNSVIYLCPFCAYEITIQTALYNFSKEYIKNLFNAIKNRAKNNNEVDTK